MIVERFQPFSDSRGEFKEVPLVYCELLSVLSAKTWDFGSSPTYILLFVSIPLNQALLKRATGIVRLLGSVANEELFLDGIVQITGLLEGTDVNFQERVQPPELIYVLRSANFT